MSKLYDVRRDVLQATDGKPLLDTRWALGTTENFAFRLRGLLPKGWFPDAPQDLEEEQAPVLNALLLGFGSVFQGVWGLLRACGAQMRLATMSGAFLDMAAADYFGPEAVKRRAREGDETYRKRIVLSLVAPKNTRQAVRGEIMALTGVEPRIIEPFNASDCHAFGSLAVPGAGGGYGYGCSGLRYGAQAGGCFFVEAKLGPGKDPQLLYQVIGRTVACGVTAWVRVEV